MHSQYALEIEAAHAQCSQQEIALINEHKKAMQSTEELHQKQLKEVKVINTLQWEFRERGAKWAVYSLPAT